LQRLEADISDLKGDMKDLRTEINAQMKNLGTDIIGQMTILFQGGNRT
jgi:hypothetical protein